MQNTILIIGYVWPEPNSSAAGSRMMQLIELFLAENWKVVFSTPALDSEHRFPLETLGVEIASIKLNCDSFDIFIDQLQPTMVFFDRFMMEEQFGWRVAKNCPNALRILETVDLHCLRKGRQQALKENRNFELRDLNSDTARREVASIYRCDLSLMISEYEMELLETYFRVPKSILHYFPFMVETVSETILETLPNYEERLHFVTIGSFLHEPNWDCVRYLKEAIWPELRNRIPNAEMHVYGSYPQQKALQLHNPKERFFIKGWAKNAEEVVKKAKVVLAPLRFGAGMKGKLLEAMYCGTPSVTTHVGAESMYGNLPWNGFIADDSATIITAAEKLYTDKSVWLEAQKNGIEILNTIFPKQTIGKLLIEKIKKVQKDLQIHREANFTGSMLLHHSMKSTEFMSRWIAEKNK